MLSLSVHGQARGVVGGSPTAVRKVTDAQLPCSDSDGLTSDSRCIWSRIRLEGWFQTLPMCNVYCQCGTGVKDINLDYLRAIVEASEGGRRCVLAFGDWNLTPEALEASGILDGLGLKIVTPTNSSTTCTAARQGSLIDYVRHRGAGL